jgi:hypothetical protein
MSAADEVKEVKTWVDLQQQMRSKRLKTWVFLPSVEDKVRGTTLVGPSEEDKVKGDKQVFDHQ